jgi:hypothetical protein
MQPIIQNPKRFVKPFFEANKSVKEFAATVPDRHSPEIWVTPVSMSLDGLFENMFNVR